MKSVVCIHGFGRHPGGRQAGFSSALRMAVVGRLGSEVAWSEVLWDDLLGSPDISSSASMLIDAHKVVCSFYNGNAGTAIRRRVRGALADASARADGGVVLVGHSFGAAIAYDVVARGLAHDVRDLLMMVAPPPGTRGLEHHRLYWYHEDVADWLARVLSASQTGGDAT